MYTAPIHLQRRVYVYIYIYLVKTFTFVCVVFLLLWLVSRVCSERNCCWDCSFLRKSSCCMQNNKSVRVAVGPNMTAIRHNLFGIDVFVFRCFSNGIRICEASKIGHKKKTIHEVTRAQVQPTNQSINQSINQ